MDSEYGVIMAKVLRPKKVDPSLFEGVVVTDSVRKLIQESNDDLLLGLVGSNPREGMKRLLEAYWGIE